MSPGTGIIVEKRDAATALIIKAFSKEGIEFDSADRDLLNDVLEKVARRTFGPNPSEMWRRGGLENGQAVVDTVAPVATVARLARELLDALDMCEEVASEEVGLDRINVAETFVGSLPEDPGSWFWEHLNNVQSVLEFAEHAMSIGRPTTARPSLLFYDGFGRELATLYWAKTLRSPITANGTPRADFVRIVFGAEKIIPSALRAGSLLTVRDRMKSAVRREREKLATRV